MHLFFPDLRGFVKLPNTLDVCNFILELLYFLIYFQRDYSLLNLEIVANANSCRNISIFLLSKLKFCCGNNSREELSKGGIYMRKYGSFQKSVNLIYERYLNSCSVRSRVPRHKVLRPSTAKFWNARWFYSDYANLIIWKSAFIFRFRLRAVVH